ncbi:MAG: molybdenum cofactor biosynthesis protein MoaB [Chloroflexi bacterium]|nr:molybdenum cofactor biosynthesis protein MoaB [Chloroflexota bacterium]BCY18099.1 molybdenum cofactor biosynthesis protein B [Leptolinea sp. HRD-7]
MENNRNLPSGKTEHHHKADNIPPARVSIVTVSDTRTEETDVNGRYLKDRIAAAGLVLVDYTIVPDEPDQIDGLIEKLVQTDTQIILFNGGTGLSRRDTTFDVIARKLEKMIPGFGEIFRLLSYEQVGAAAMFSRAVAGVYKGKVIMSTPGSPAAVQLAWEKLIAPEIQHLAWEVNR